MKLFSSIEEKYCPNLRKNVAIEVTRMCDGKSTFKCLNQAECPHNCEKK